MPNDYENKIFKIPEDNIYDAIIVVLTDKKEYEVINIKNHTTIKSGIKDADTALMIKKAYFMGYYDATHQ